MRQWIENLAEKIKTSGYTTTSKSKRLEINGYTVFVSKFFDNKWYDALMFINASSRDYYIKLYEDEVDLLTTCINNRLSELDQQEINNFIGLCK